MRLLSLAGKQHHQERGRPEGTSGHGHSGGGGWLGGCNFVLWGKVLSPLMLKAKLITQDFS